MDMLKELPYKVITNTLDVTFFFCVILGLLMKFKDGFEIGHVVVLFVVGGLSFALRTALWVLRGELGEEP